jgi:hypothetical protein
VLVSAAWLANVEDSEPRFPFTHDKNLRNAVSRKVHLRPRLRQQPRDVPLYAPSVLEQHSLPYSLTSAGEASNRFDWALHTI